MTHLFKKRNSFFYRVSCCLFVFLCYGFLTVAQTSKGSEKSPYEQQTTLPSFTIRLLDSTTLFNTRTIAKGKPTVFVLFSPDCSHCSQIAQSVKTRISEFEAVNLYFIAPPMPFYDIRRFAHLNGLVGKSQITVGQDIDFFFGSFFKAETVPFVAIYDRNKKFAAALKHMKDIDELLAETAKLK